MASCFSCVFSATIAASVALSATADTYNVPGDYGTIQAAWDAVDGSGGPGWFIMVEPGTYTENLDLSGKTCWVIGMGNPGDVVIDGNSTGACIEVTNSPFGGAVFLENLTITNGSGVISGTFSFGGGIDIWDGGRVELHQCRVVENTAIFGGGAYVTGTGSLYVYESYFAGNVAFIGGGIGTDSTTTVQSSTMAANTAYYGGNICSVADSAQITLRSSIFSGGQSVYSGSDNASGGGALAVLGAGPVKIVSCDFLDNDAEERGGAVYVSDPYMYGGDRTVTISDSLFRLNDADVGGAIYFNETGSMDVTGTEFVLNESSKGGSGCWLQIGTFNFYGQCLFDGNVMEDIGTGFRSGGAIFALECESLSISDSTFQSNLALQNGGALYLNSAPTTLTNVTMDANDANSTGDAIYAVESNFNYQNDLIINGGIIRNHPDSTAVFQRLGRIIANGCTISNNGAAFLGGGGIWLDNDSAGKPSSFTNCDFIGNTSGQNGAALFLDDVTITLTNCDFDNNEVDGPNDFRGGAIFIQDASNLTVQSCAFTGNSCDGDGGAIGVWFDCNLQVLDSNFTQNTATEDGGAIHVADTVASTTISGCTFDENESSLAGGAVYNDFFSISLDNCEVTSNTAGTLGGGIRADAYTTLANSVVCGNSPSQVSGNIGDLGGNVITTTCNPCPADFNGDGVVDGTDLSLLLGNWGVCVGCPEDLTGDGVVGGADLSIVLGSWGPCP